MWVSSAKAVTQLASWAVSLVLARLLLPADFGLVAMAWTFIGFLEQVNQLGIGAAIIQRDDLTDDDHCTLFWIGLGAGLLFFLLAVALAGSLAMFFGNERLTAIIRLLGLTIILSALNTVPFNLLTRSLAFGRRSRAEVLSVISGGLTSLALATHGYGVMSLVFGTLTQQTVLTATIWYLAGWKPAFRCKLGRIATAFRFGLSVMMARIIWYWYSSADAIIVGKLLGERFLGIYSMGMQLSTLPVQKITAIVNQVAFPVFSQLQHDLPKLRSYFLQITRYVALITFPTMVALVCVADPLVRFLLTDKWLPVVSILRMLCVIGMVKSVDAIIPNLLMARGKGDILVKYNLACLLVLPTAFGLGAYWGGLTGVATAWLLAYPLLLSYLLTIGLRELDLSLADYLKNMVPAVLIALATGAGILLYSHIDARGMEQAAWLSLVAAGLAGATSGVGALFFALPTVAAELKTLGASLKSGGKLAETHT